MSADPITAAMDCFWRARKLTYDLLTDLPEETLILHFPRPKLDTVGQQLAEMADVTIAYAKSIEAGSMDFGAVRWDFPENLTSSRDELMSYLRKSDEAITKAVESADIDAEIDLFGVKESLLGWLIGLVQHETLHHGQIALFFLYNKVAMPDSWIEEWAFPKLKGDSYTL